MKDPTFGEMADALHLIREELLDHLERNERFDWLFGEQLRPLYDALREYFAWRDRRPEPSVGKGDNDDTEDGVS